VVRKTEMNLKQEHLLRVLHIGHDSSMRGEGISLHEALIRCDYRTLHGQIGTKDIIPLLRTNPDLIAQWFAYCEDKRTKGGYWLSKENLEVGSLELPEPIIRCGSVEEAVAEFVIRELDYWFEVGESDSN
jgi:hypothetical protein